MTYPNKRRKLGILLVVVLLFLGSNAGAAPGPDLVAGTVKMDNTGIAADGGNITTLYGSNITAGARLWIGNDSSVYIEGAGGVITFLGTITGVAIDGATLSGTIAGTPTFSGDIELLDGSVSSDDIATTLTSKVISGGTVSGVTMSGTIAGTPTFSGAVVFSGNPSFTGDPEFVDGTISSGDLAAALTGKTYNGLTITTTTGTLTISNGKTLTASNTLTFTGTDGSSVAFGTGGTVAYTANKLSAFAATTSAELASVLSDESGSSGGFVRAGQNLGAFGATSSDQLAGVMSDETGSGALVFGTSPTLVTPNIASFANAGHDHTNAAGGGQLSITGATSGTLTATRGGTGQSTWATGDMLYASGENTLAKLAAGTDGHILTLASGVPTWAAAAAGTTKWNSITNPDGALSLTMAGHKTTFGGYSATTTDAIATRVSGDSSDRFLINADGTLAWTDGTGTSDTISLGWVGASDLSLFGAIKGEVLFDMDGGDISFFDNPSDAQPSIRFEFDATPRLEFGPGGSTSPDTILSRGAASRFDIASGDSLRIVSGFLDLGSLALGTCDSTTRGQMQFVEGGAGVADALHMCMKKADDTYAWQAIHTAS